MGDLSVEEALLLINGWLGQTVRLLVMVQLEDSDQPPPSGPAPGWHVMVAHEAELRRPDLSGNGVDTDLSRHMIIGTYEMGVGPLKLFLGDGVELHFKRILAEGKPAHKVVFFLQDSKMVILLQQLQSATALTDVAEPGSSF